MTTLAEKLAQELLEPIEGFPAPTALEAEAARHLLHQAAEIERLQCEVVNRNQRALEGDKIVHRVDALCADVERKNALLQDALSAWNTICDSQGWERDHMQQFVDIKAELEE